MKTLYRFRLSPDNSGKIEKRAITDYEEWGEYYRWKGDSCTCWVKKCNLDKMFVNGVYTFNPNENRAKRIFIGALTKKADKYLAEYNKVMRTIDKIEGNN